jgi:UDP-N-acetylglucosamine:LPS N-acetylglucosamine transferase
MILQSDFSGKVLAEALEALAENPEALVSMAKKARILGKPDAASRIVGECCRLIFDHPCLNKNASPRVAGVGEEN